MKIARGITLSGEQVWAEVQTDSGKPTFRRLAGNPLLGLSTPGETVVFRSLLAPIEPAALLCIGKNYREHTPGWTNDQIEFPIIIPKGVTAVQHPGQPIVLPRFLTSSKVDYEGELAVIIGRDCKNVTPEKALDYVFGYTCANDVSARDWQFDRGGGQYARGKQFDTFAPMGPWMVTADEIPDPSSLLLTTRLNGKIVQKDTTASFIFDLPTVITFLSGSTTLAAGTVILTGTPGGTGMRHDPPRWLRAGDEVSVSVEGIGELINPVEEEVLT
jgi:2-keto-4-pentenoate hydratase/2-oxohepta-3-ene-1,7-dioic acid hydratase in catechol pathway